MVGSHFFFEKMASLNNFWGISVFLQIWREVFEILTSPPPLVFDQINVWTVASNKVRSFFRNFFLSSSQDQAGWRLDEVRRNAAGPDEENLWQTVVHAFSTCQRPVHTSKIFQKKSPLSFLLLIKSGISFICRFVWWLKCVERSSFLQFCDIVNLNKS